MNRSVLESIAGLAARYDATIERVQSSPTEPAIDSKLFDLQH